MAAGATRQKAASRSSRLVSLAAALALTAVFSAAAAPARAQITNVGDAEATPIPSAGHDYIHLLSETVNPADGSVSVRIVIPTPQGRGPAIPAGFAYDSNGTHTLGGDPDVAGAGDWSTNTGYLSQGGGEYLLPRLTGTTFEQSGDSSDPTDPGWQCEVTTNFMYEDPQGGRHGLGLGGAWDWNSGGCSYASPSAYAIPTAGEGPILAQCSNADGEGCIDGAVTVTDKDGTAYFFPTPFLGGPNEFNPDTVVPTTITDRNGNHETISASVNGAFTITDAIGRTAVSSSSFGAGGGDEITVAGQGTFTVYWGTASSNFYSTVVHYGPTQTYCSVQPHNQSTQNVITEIVLPNGQAYHFYYDSTYGVLDKIVYPGGGYVAYQWILPSSPNLVATYPAADFSDNKETCNYQYSAPVINQRTVSDDGAHVAEIQSFIYTTTFPTNDLGWTSKETDVSTADQTVSPEKSRWTDYHYLPYGIPDQPNTYQWIYDVMPLESEVVHDDWSPGGVGLLETVDEQWANPRVLTSRKVTLPNNEVSETDWTYNTWEQPTKEDIYDYGAGARGALLRETDTSYNYAAFNGAHIVDRPSSVQVEDGSGCLWSETTSGYDTRGNPTSDAKWVGAPQAGCVSPSSPGGATLTTQFTYDGNGQRLTMTEPNGAVTSYGYTDSFADQGPGTQTDAYLTTETLPQACDPGCVTQVKHYAWDYATGALASFTDPNGQTTSYTYAAPFNRLSKVNFPDGGETDYFYSDTPGSVSTETKRKIDATRWTDHYDVFDGLGRPIASSTFNDNGGTGQWDRIDTSYDGEGQVAFRSYPCLATSGTGAAQCTAGDSFLYDALARPTQTTHSPNGTTFLTSYTGRSTETQDEGNGSGRVTHILQHDALGELTSVCEVTGTYTDAAGNAAAACGQDIAGTGYLTSYAYSPLGDLLTVNQGAEIRSFTYDSLSRILTAKNPETGTTNYVYGSDGNCAAPNSFPGDLVSRTDARGIRTCYQHDPLHRLTERTYSDGTLPVSFQYDEPNVWGHNLQNPIGRLTLEQVSGPPVSGSLFSYDSVGRVLHGGTCTPSTCGWGGFDFVYTYDLIGDQLTQQFLSPPTATLTTSYNASGRPTAVTSTIAGALISNVSYL